MKIYEIDKNKIKTHLYVDRRLREWGWWYNKYLEHGLGYKSKSTVAQLRDDGGIVSKSTAPAAIPINPTAEEVDTQINALNAYNPILARVIKIYYADQLNYDQIRQNHQLAKTTFKSHLETARAFIAARLTR